MKIKKLMIGQTLQDNTTTLMIIKECADRATGNMTKNTSTLKEGKSMPDKMRFLSLFAGIG